MTNNTFTPTWHKDSYDRFLHERLPQLLAERLPLIGYETETTATYTCQVAVTIEGPNGGVTLTCANLPYPDEDGIFHVNSELRTVVPWVAHSDLESAAVKCVGELLGEWIDERLGEAPTDLPWDDALLRAWLPLDKWIHDFMGMHRHAQLLDVTNWLARQCHPRRIIIDQRTSLTTTSQFGRVDPFEIPEGPNMGRIFAIARGAGIRDGRIIIEDDSPEAMLGTTSAMIPCLEHDDPNRLLMGANMMRQWLPYTEPEPALVQTGNEPNAPYFWCGRNLLTAFIPWGEETFEDGIVLSASAARHLSNLQQSEMLWSNGEPFDLYHEVEAGDKLSNRHGIKGVVSAIRPDAQMPTLADGTPVDLVFSSLRLPGRMNLGQLREAVLGRIARHEGTPLIAPPFHGPDEAEIRRRLAAASLPEDGMETLYSNGKPLAHLSLVGWVYWGRTHHLARDKFHFSVDSTKQGQRMADMEVNALRRIGATEILREHFNTRALTATEKDTTAHPLAERLATGVVDQAGAPTPRFVALQRRLAAAGIRLDFDGTTVRCTSAPPAPDRLTLAQPVAHPWWPEQKMSSIGSFPTLDDRTIGFLGLPWQPDMRRGANQDAAPMPEFSTVCQANEKLARLLTTQAPDRLLQQARTQLQDSINNYLNTLLQPNDLRLEGRACFTGRAVLAPGPALRHDQIGFPEEMAWAFFGPQVARKLGADAVTSRTNEAADALDAIMADAWIVLHRAPTAEPTGFLAFHPHRIPERVVRLPSLACPLLDIDFDGDQIAIHLPVTAAGQREAGESLTIVAHLRRNPALLERMTKQDEATWGLAYHSLSVAGRDEIAQAAGVEIPAPDGFITRATLVRALQDILAAQGADAVLTKLHRLMQLGFAVAAQTGFSMSPFVGASMARPPASSHDEPQAWQVYQAQMMEKVLATEPLGEGIGPYVLAIKSGAVPGTHLNTLTYLLGTERTVTDAHGQQVVVRCGFRDGLSPEDFLKVVPGARAGMDRIWRQWEELDAFPNDSREAKSFHFLARARRSQNPGIVFAQAAATGEIDPLVDEESRLFVGVFDNNRAYAVQGG